MKYCYQLSLLTLLIALFSGCEKNEDPTENPDFSRGIYIVNEGAFQSNNGSISHFDPESGTITNNIFEAANGRPLGDVVQSFATVGDTIGFIVVNGSAKIEVVDLRTFITVAEPIPVDYPRYFMHVADDRGYLTGGSFQGYVYHIDLKTFKITDSIKVGFGPDALVQHNNYVYVANSGGFGIDSTIHAISVSNDLLTDTIRVGKAPGDLVFDGSDNLWVYCRGHALYNWQPPYELISETDALLQKVDITLGNMLFEVAVGKAGDYTATPPRIAVSPEGEHIYYLRPDGVYKISATDPEIPEYPLIPGSFYGMDVNPADGNVYVFEASFTGNGTMKIFTGEGLPVGEGTVGIAPNGAVFH